jgi:hypothetical protein
MATDRSEKAALAHAAKGYPVLPLEPPSVHGSGGKDPIGLLAPHGAHSATTDEQTIRRWWRAEPGANIGIALGNGIMGLDADPRHGVDPDEIAERIGMPPLVRTGEAGEPDRSHPNSLSGVRGGHWYFRADAKGCDAKGIELRGSGRYLVAPGSRHASGVLYEGELPPPSALPPMPDAVPELFSGNGKGPAPSVDGEIPRGERDNVLTSLAGSMRRRGMIEPEILAALRETNRRCQPPLDDRDVAKIAKSVSRYAPAESWRQDGEASSMTTAGAAEISLRWWREEDIRPVRWAWEGRIPIGSLTSLTADGGMGKGTLAAWIAARLSRGELPGNYFGTPVTIFVIGTHEDGVGDTWVPRVKAAGGDVTRIASLETEFGREIDLVRDIKRIEALIQEHGFGFGYLDQVLDHFSGDSNSHIQQDVRRTLRPIQALAREREIGVMFTAHPSLASAGPRGIREGGSVQFGNVVRSALILGWHPELRGVRALARRKGNMGRVPPALTFTIEQATVAAPETGETVPIGTVSCPAEDDELRWEHVLFSPPHEPGETKVDVIERVMHELGANGERHTRREAENACLEAGVSESTFAKRYPRLDFIEIRGREWRVKN